MPSYLRNGINAAGFSAVWLTCALWADGAAAALALVMAAAHILIISAQPQSEVRGLIMCAVVGIALDTAWQNLGVLRFPANEGAYAEGLVPVWMTGIWLAFATTLNHSLRRILYGRNSSLLFPVLAGPAHYWLLTFIAPLEVGYGWIGYAGLSAGFVLTFRLQRHIIRWANQID